MAVRLAVTGAIAALAICTAYTAAAQTAEKRPASLDVTMTLLPEHAKGPDEITRRIELPRPKDAGEHKDAAPDTDPNGSHKDDKGPPSDPGEQGHSKADQARERGRDFGQEVAEQARENRENAGHGNAGNNGNGGGNGGGKGPPVTPPGHP